jgi:hypothetical protein
VTVKGDLNIEGATFYTSESGYSPGIIPGGDNWFVTAGANAANDL